MNARMRQLAPATNLVLAVLAAFVLLTTLEFPWVAPAVADPASTDGTVERVAFQVAHVFERVEDATPGSMALGGYRYVIAGLVSALVALCGLAGMLPRMRAAVREPLRIAALVLPVAVACLVIARPGADGETIQWGALLGIVVAAFAGNAAWHGSAIRGPRPQPVLRPERTY
jgi:hypothetical protein